MFQLFAYICLESKKSILFGIYELILATDDSKSPIKLFSKALDFWSEISDENQNNIDF